MTDKARIRVAALITALFLAAVSLAGIATRSDIPKAPATPAPSAAVQQTTPAAPALAISEHEDGEHDE